MFIAFSCGTLRWSKRVDLSRCSTHCRFRFDGSILCGCAVLCVARNHNYSFSCCGNMPQRSSVCVFSRWKRLCGRSIPLHSTDEKQNVQEYFSNWVKKTLDCLLYFIFLSSVSCGSCWLASFCGLFMLFPSVELFLLQRTLSSSSAADSMSPSPHKWLRFFFHEMHIGPPWSGKWIPH